MLLQRDMPVRIFGKAAPAESVSVSFRGQNVQATTDALGRWEVWLAPMKPGAAAEMTIEGANKIKVSDVLVGDVWLGSGQSNMQWAVRQTNNADQEIASAKFPEIRLFYVPRKPSGVPVDDVEAKWLVCSPETIQDFSAVLFYFGRQFHQDLKVPMGLIHTSWGGTPIASWISGPTLSANPRLGAFPHVLGGHDLQVSRQLHRYEQNLKKWDEGGSKGPRPACRWVREIPTSRPLSTTEWWLRW